MNVITRPKPKAKISSAEIERRRKIVASGIASNRMEGAQCDPKVMPIFDAYIKGEIEVTDIIPRLNSIYAP